MHRELGNRVDTQQPEEHLVVTHETLIEEGNRMRKIQYAAYCLTSRFMNGILSKGNRKAHFLCVKKGIQMMYPPVDKRVTGFYKAARKSTNKTEGKRRKKN